MATAPTATRLEKGELEAIRDRVLKKWRLVKGPEKKERIAEALDKLIEELQRDSQG